MRTSHGLGRLVGFSDGVVAIAITLLILPLVESVAELDGDVIAFLEQSSYQVFVFVLSFAVIGNFWWVHHQLYERAIGYNGPLIWANLLWLLSIVFLPFPTELLASSGREDPATYALYIGTMVVTTAAGLLQQVILLRSPELQAEAVRGHLRLITYVVPLVLMSAALVIAVVVPVIGLAALLLLAAGKPMALLINRIRKGRA